MVPPLQRETTLLAPGAEVLVRPPLPSQLELMSPLAPTSPQGPAVALALTLELDSPEGPPPQAREPVRASP